MIQPLAGSASNVSDMFLVLVCWNDRRCLRSHVFRHVERGRLSSRSFIRRLKISQNRSRDSSTSLGMTRIRSAAGALTSLIASPRPMLPRPAHYRMEIGRVIRAANQRTGGDVKKAFSTRHVAVVIELLRRDVFDHRQMLRTSGADTGPSSRLRSRPRANRPSSGKVRSPSRRDRA